ncbi:MAG: N-acetylmuramoyl-L-alanine amidase-like domain-containing protein [Saprospiraceae bacterium]
MLINLLFAASFHTRNDIAGFKESPGLALTAMNLSKLDRICSPATNTSDSLIFLAKQKLAIVETTLSAKTLAVARSFVGIPYVSGCLDRNSEECLAVNLCELDCWTFVENSLAIALAEPGDFQSYKDHLQQLRYWGGYINGYGSRIHYFTGWLLQCEKLGILKDLTETMGGIPYRKNVGYISARPAKYPKIKNANNLRAIKAAERRINAHRWFFIPQNRIAEIEQFIQDGDIISLTAWKPELDIAHQGFAVKIKGRIHLLHASSLGKKVVLSTQPLAQYVLAQRGQTGIMVARFQ